MMSRGWLMIRRRRQAPRRFDHAPRPLRAAILAIDSARRSGYAVYVAGELVQYGECNARRFADRLSVLEIALMRSKGAQLPLGLVLEEPFGGTLATALSLHASLELWRDTWLAIGGKLRHVAQERAADWRLRLFGSARMPRDQVRRLEQITAQRIAALAGYRGDIGGDAAAAICLGYAHRQSALLHKSLRCALVDPRARGGSHGAA